MSEASYTAWDDNLYAWPPPEGWYQASDGRWWPAGYGPAERSPASDAPAAEAAAVVPAAGSPDPYDQRTSAIPAGGLAAAAAASGPVERAEAETRRRVFDELPPIDDVFGGIDPYADDEEAMGSEPAAAGGEGDEPAVQAPPGPAGNGSLSSPPAAPPPPSALLGDPGAGNGSAPDTDPPGFHDAVTVFAPSPPPPPRREPTGDDPTGPMAGSPAAPPEPPPAPPASGAGPGRPPVEEWAAATTILPRDDDGATTQLDLDALQEADRAASRGGPSPSAWPDQRAGGWGPDADWPDDEGRRRGPVPAAREPALAGGGAGFHREFAEPDDEPSGRAGGYGGYGDVPLGAAPAPRRWWPLVAIGLAVLVAAASIGGYFLLRDDSQNSATDGGDPAGEGPPGSFASPYPFGKVVVVYYNDEATNEQRRWVIQVLAPVADATQQLVSAGTASAPGQGEVLAQVRVRITYQSGPEPGSLSDLRFKAVGGAPGTEFDAAAACPAAAPLDEAAQVTVLDSAEGDLCWRIPQGELATLKLAVEAEAADGTVHMELNAPAGG